MQESIDEAQGFKEVFDRKKSDQISDVCKKFI